MTAVSPSRVIRTSSSEAGRGFFRRIESVSDFVGSGQKCWTSHTPTTAPGEGLERRMTCSELLSSVQRSTLPSVLHHGTPVMVKDDRLGTGVWPGASPGRKTGMASTRTASARQGAGSIAQEATRRARPRLRPARRAPCIPWRPPQPRGGGVPTGPQRGAARLAHAPRVALRPRSRRRRPPPPGQDDVASRPVAPPPWFPPWAVSICTSSPSSRVSPLMKR